MTSNALLYLQMDSTSDTSSQKMGTHSKVATDNYTEMQSVNVQEPDETGLDARQELCGLDLVFRDVSASLGGRKILHNVSGEVTQSTMLAILGSSGE